MTKTTESVLFLFSPPIQACYSLSSAPTGLNSQSFACESHTLPLGYHATIKIAPL